MTAPQQNLRLQIGWSADISSDLAAVSWTDETSRLKLSSGVSFNSGAADEYGFIQGGTCSFTLKNADNRYTPENSSGALYPNVDLGRPVRLSWINPRVNLITYPNLDGGVLGTWTATGGACTGAVSSAYASSGTYSYMLTSTAITAISAWNGSLISVTSGTSYAFSFKTRAGASARAVSAGIDWRNSAGSVIQSSQGTQRTNTTTGWTTVSVVAVAPANAVTCLPVIRVYNVGAIGEKHYFDDFLFEQSDTVGTYFDGSTSGYAWSGAANASTSVGTYTNLWTGHITGFVSQWENGIRSLMQVEAADIVARAQSTKFAGLLAEEILADGPACYYPLNDSGVSAMFGDASSNNNDELTVATVGSPSASAIVAQVAATFGADETTAVAQNGSVSGNFKYLRNDQYIAPGSGFTIEGCFIDQNVTHPTTLDLFVASNRTRLISIGWDNASGGKILARVYQPNGSVLKSILSDTVPIFNTTWCHVAITLSKVGSTVTMRLYKDGVLQGAGNPYTYTDTTDFTVSGLSVFSDDALNLNGYCGTAAHFATYNYALSDVRIAQHAAAMTGAASETSLARFQRIGRLSGLPYTNTGASAYQAMCPQPFVDKSAYDAFKGVADTEMGEIFVNESGYFTYIGRNDVVTRTPVTLSASMVSTGTQMPYDDQKVMNVCTVSRPFGANQVARDAASVLKYGERSESLEVFTTSDPQARGIAQRRLGGKTTPSTRLGNIQLDLATLSQNVMSTQEVVNIGVGTAINLTDIPAGALTTMPLYVEGESHQIDPNSWQVTFNTSPLEVHASMTLDSPTFGILDGNYVLGP